MTDRTARKLSLLVHQLAAPDQPERAKPLPRWIGSSAEHLRVSKLRADHDRVPLAELQRELRLNRLANDGQQSEAARALEVTEGCLRHWLRGRWLPPRWAVDRLRERREKLWPSRRVAG